MARLTERISENIIELHEKANPIQYNGSPQRVHVKHPFWNVFNRLCDYETAEEQGLLLRLPCPEGTKVWSVDFIYDCEFNYDCKLKSGKFKCEEDIPCLHEKKIWRVKESVYNHRMFEAMGHTVFLTKAEAEKALEEMG